MRIDDKFRLDLVLLPVLCEETSKLKRGFETHEEAIQEDATRISKIRLALPRREPPSWPTMGTLIQYLKQLTCWLPAPAINEVAAQALIEKLESGIQTGSPARTLASSLYMRELRLTKLGAILSAIDHIPNEELRVSHIINCNWLVSYRDLDSISAAAIKSQFRTHLNRVGITEIPGFLIAFLHSEFDPISGKYQLHLHCLSTVEKAEALTRLIHHDDGSDRGWGYTKTITGSSPIRREEIKDRIRQVSYLFKSFWLQKAIRWIEGCRKRDRRGKRICEPFHTQVLLWLDRQKVADLILLDGCRFMPNGELRLKPRLYTTNDRAG